jgi:hypothetical protein
MLRALESDAPARGQVIITDADRRNNYFTWQAFQESNWGFFGIPAGARVAKRRLEDEKATLIEWEVEEDYAPLARAA